MADDGSTQSQNNWPLPTFNFRVKIGGLVGNFSEVSGLDVETQLIEYRGDKSPILSRMKMPGIVKSGNVTLKKGIFSDKNGFLKIYSSQKLNTINTYAVTISLLDEENNVIMSWTLANAWFTKITSNDINPESNEAAVESMELAHEGITLAKT